MGSFEKLVVATVFFLSAVVLAVSLTSQKPADGEEGRSPLGERVAEAPRSEPAVSVPAPTAADPRRTSGESQGSGRGPLPLLSSSVQAGNQAAPTAEEGAPAAPVLTNDGDAPTGVAGTPTGQAGNPTGQAGTPTGQAGNPASARGQGDLDPVAPGAGADGKLRSLAGLQRSPTEGRWLYTWAAGDTWTGVAQRLYGSGAFAEDLRVANDDASPSAGTFVVVPEQIGGVSRNTSADPRLPRPAPRPAPAVPADVGSAPVVSDAGGSFVEHVVQNGETLSSIAERYYGTAARWTRVYDANRDRLANPDRVPVGTRLRIP
ncbi:MAG: LysM peptidoglycan-binding domain-containing protein [Planctomycetaceae bacterium]|nr:LysM peptidoglycan-binding domain-containing protein [Planctomycetaceae bacterium]